jgi:hypothetical protein
MTRETDVEQVKLRTELAELMQISIQDFLELHNPLHLDNWTLESACSAYMSCNDSLSMVMTHVVALSKIEDLDESSLLWVFRHALDYCDFGHRALHYARTHWWNHLF